MQPKHTFAVTLAVLALLLGGGWFYFNSQNGSSPDGQTTGNDIEVDADGNVQVTEVPIDNPTTPPPTIAKLSFAEGVPPDVQAALKIQYDTFTSQLKKEPTRVDIWLKLGLTFKLAGQYKEAETAWRYVAEASPESIDYVAWGNLGDLYLNFTHEYAKAEAAYRQALKGAPENADYQSGLATAIEKQ